MTGMREDLDRKLHHRQPSVDHPRRGSGETHLPGCPVYHASDQACPAECNCWPWTEGNAEQPPPASLTLDCVCTADGPCLGVPGESDTCRGCLVLDPEHDCLAAFTATDRAEVGW